MILQLFWVPEKLTAELFNIHQRCRHVILPLFLLWELSVVNHGYILIKLLPPHHYYRKPKVNSLLAPRDSKKFGYARFRDWYWQIVTVDISFVMTVWAVEKNKNLERTGAIFCSPICSVTTAPYLVRLLEKKKVFESGPPKWTSRPVHSYRVSKSNITMLGLKWWGQPSGNERRSKIFIIARS